GNDGEGENINDFSINSQKERQFAFHDAGPGHTHRQDNAIGALGDFMDRNILSQSPAQEAIGQRRKQALVMIEKAGGAFGYGKASDQVVWGEIVASKTWVAEKKLSQWRKPEEEAKNFTVSPDVGETTPH